MSHQIGLSMTVNTVREDDKDIMAAVTFIDITNSYRVWRSKGQVHRDNSPVGPRVPTGTPADAHGGLDGRGREVDHHQLVLGVQGKVLFVGELSSFRGSNCKHRACRAHTFPGHDTTFWASTQA